MLDRSRYVTEFEDRFEGEALDRRRWLPYYLPQWSSRERSAARYALRDGTLRLRIERDQPPWCPELDGELLVCPICFNARKLDQAQLVPSARLAGATPLWEWIGDGATVFSY